MGKTGINCTINFLIIFECIKILKSQNILLFFLLIYFLNFLSVLYLFMNYFSYRIFMFWDVVFVSFC